MLLGIMRKHAKSWLIKFLIGIIAVVFIFYFGYSFTARRPDMEACGLRKVMKGLRDVIAEMMENTTLADLIAQ